MPVGAESTLPVPLPDLVTVSVWLAGWKFAKTFFAASIVTTQVMPVHAPLQPTKLEPGSGITPSVTLLPAAKLAMHVAPQLIPAGELVTVPEEAPPRLTLSWTVLDVTENARSTFGAAV